MGTVANFVLNTFYQRKKLLIKLENKFKLKKKSKPKGQTEEMQELGENYKCAGTAWAASCRGGTRSAKALGLRCWEDSSRAAPAASPMTSSSLDLDQKQIPRLLAQPLLPQGTATLLQPSQPQSLVSRGQLCLC